LLSGGLLAHLLQAALPLRHRLRQQRGVLAKGTASAARPPPPAHQHPAGLDRHHLLHQLAAPQPVQPHRRPEQLSKLLVAADDDLLRRLSHDGHVLRLLQPRPVRLPERELLEGVQGHPVHLIGKKRQPGGVAEALDPEQVQQGAGEEQAGPGDRRDGVPAVQHGQQRHDRVDQVLAIKEPEDEEQRPDQCK
jgi:hypothetical protein